MRTFRLAQLGEKPDLSSNRLGTLGDPGTVSRDDAIFSGVAVFSGELLHQKLFWPISGKELEYF